MSDCIPVSDFHVCRQAQACVHVEERAEGQDVIKGHAAVFYDAGDPGAEFHLGRYVRERIARGAFDGALVRPDDVRALRDHDPSLLLGRTTSGTLRLSVSKRGLQFEIDPDTTTVAADTKKMVKRGDLTGASFGFVVEKESFEDDGDEIIRTIEAVNPLIDISPVTFPAFTGTDAGIAKAKRSHFTESLTCYIVAHRDDHAGTQLETRAAKLFGIEIPKAATPELFTGLPVVAARRRLRLIEMGRQIRQGR